MTYAIVKRKTVWKRLLKMLNTQKNRWLANWWFKLYNTESNYWPCICQLRCNFMRNKIGPQSLEPVPGCSICRPLYSICGPCCYGLQQSSKGMYRLFHSLHAQPSGCASDFQCSDLWKTVGIFPDHISSWYNATLPECTGLVGIPKLYPEQPLTHAMTPDNHKPCSPTKIFTTNKLGLWNCLGHSTDIHCTSGTVAVYI